MSQQLERPLQRSRAGALDADFEDALLICLDVLETTNSMEEAREGIIYLLDLYREAKHAARAKVIKKQLGALRQPVLKLEAGQEDLGGLQGPPGGDYT